MTISKRRNVILTVLAGLLPIVVYLVTRFTSDEPRDHDGAIAHRRRQL